MCNVKTFRFIIIKKEIASIISSCIYIELRFSNNVIARYTIYSLLLSRILLLIICVDLSCFKSKINVRTKLAFAKLYCIAIEIFVEDIFENFFQIALLLFTILILIIFVDLYCLELSKTKFDFAN